MTHAAEMLENHPHRRRANVDALALAIEACFDCAETCTACSDACLAEDGLLHLTDCIRLNSSCADVCQATGKLLLRSTGGVQELFLRHQLEACIAVCRACARECRKHADRHSHCRVCEEVCRDCERACRAVLSTVAR